MKFDDFPAKTLMEITTRPPLVFVRGEGSWLWDHEGKRYLDFVQGWAVNCLGHSPSVMTEHLGFLALINEMRSMRVTGTATLGAKKDALARFLKAFAGPVAESFVKEIIPGA